MYQRLTTALLRWLRVPHEPHPPAGDPASLRVFRAGLNFYHLRLVRWGVAQLGAFIGIVFWVVVFVDVETAILERGQTKTVRINPSDTRDFADYVEKIGAAQKPAPAPAAPATPNSAPKAKRPRVRVNGWAGFKLMLVQLALWLPAWAFPVIWALKILGILAYFVQLPFTYLIARLDYELRWYMVTDRSLRIRHGVWKISESTMSFANIQQVEVQQGPLQRLLGLADVRVQSAGGAGGDPHHRAGAEDDLHLGLFHSVTNAAEIRDLILARLRSFRQAGLGDPDDHHEPAAVAAIAPSAPTPVSPVETLAAAQELLTEAKALRATLS